MTDLHLLLFGCVNAEVMDVFSGVSRCRHRGCRCRYRRSGMQRLFIRGMEGQSAARPTQS